MWKKFRIGLCITFTLIAALIVAVPNVDALQKTLLGRLVDMLYALTSEIQITATPVFGAMPVTGFRVEQIGEDIVCSWTNSPTGTATMIRAKYGSVPADINDGYLVYYGPAESVVDSGVYLDENISQIIYVAWADTPSGWSVPVQAVYEGIMQTLILVLVVMVLVYFSNKSQLPILKVVAGIVAVGFGAYYCTYLTTSFIYPLIGIGYIFFGFFNVVTAWRRPTQQS